MADKKELFSRFHEIAVSPKKQMEKYQEQGRKIVLCVPGYTPDEIIHSMGMVPMGTWGADLQLKEAKRYFPAFICSILQSVLELGITGEYEGACAIVIPHLCDSLRSIGQNWKVAVPSIPFIQMNYPQNRKIEAGKKFTKAGYQRVISDLENASGLTFSDEELAKSNDIYNEHNAVMREFEELAKTRSMTAQERNDVFKSAFFMLKEEHTALVRELNEVLRAEPDDTSHKIRIVTSGILADSLALLKILDDNNMKIVADDVLHESRQYRTDIKPAETALDGLVNKFSEMDNCSLLYNRYKGHVDYVVNLVKENQAAGLLMIMTKFCDPEEFDYVFVKKLCDEQGISMISVEVDRQMVHYEQAATMIESWKEMMM